MTRPEELTELSLRWSEWLLRHNRRAELEREQAARNLERARRIDIEQATDSLRLEADEDEHRREHCVLVVEGSEFIIRVPSSPGCREAAS
jgi:hypothetical protein